MDRIIDEGLRRLKGRIEKIAGEAFQGGLDPRSHSEFEQKLHEALGEVGCTVEKAVLESADVERPCIHYGGLRHYRKYKGPQEYQCLFGKIEVYRSVYQANGERTLCPLEVNAGILHHHLTPAAAEFVAYSTAHMVPGELAEFCRRWQFLTPSETVIKQVAAQVGGMSEALSKIYAQRIHNEEPPVDVEDVRVVAFSRDGTSVNVREEGWRQAQVGSISFYGKKVKNGKGERKRRRLRTVYVGQMPEEKTPTFETKFEREIDRTLATIPCDTRLACIADGARSNWKYFESHPQLKNAVHINDFWHAASYLSKASDALFGEGTANGERWFKKYRHILKTEDGALDQVIRSIRYYRKRRGIRSAQRQATIRKVLGYLARNRDRMQYAAYRRRGLPIGSGVVEAACKTMVGQRLKRAGMRWSRRGGQSILNLRAAVLSRRWDFFWRCHQDAIAFTPILRLVA